MTVPWLAALAATAPDPDTIRDTARRILENEVYRLDDRNRRNLLIEALKWIWEKIAGLFDAILPASVLGSQTVLWMIVAAAVLMLIGLIGHIAYTLYRGLRTTPEPVVIEEELPTDAETLVARAREFAAAGDYVDASRLLYRAALVRLETERGGRFQQGLTNTEYLKTFRTPWIRENLKIFVDLINWKWYRARQFDAADYDQCREAYERLDLRLREGT